MKANLFQTMFCFVLAIGVGFYIGSDYFTSSKYQQARQERDR
jgi:hypothetical protein